MDVAEKRLDSADAEADKIWKETYQKSEDKPEEVKEEVVAETKEDTSPDGETLEETPSKPEVKKIESVDYSQKYKVLQGKYDAEVPRLHEEKKRLAAESAELREKVSKLEDAVKESQTQKQSEETDAELDELALDYPQHAENLKKVKAEFNAKLQAVRDEKKEGIKSELDSVKNEIVQIKQERFDIDMARLGVPDWKEVDADPAFMEWLGEPVPYTNTTKLQILQDAARKLNAPLVSQFFLDYKKSLGETAPPQGSDSQEKLKKFVAPPKGTGGTAPKVNAQSSLTREQYKKFMDSSMKGKFNPSEWGGKSETQVEEMFEKAFINKTVA